MRSEKMLKTLARRKNIGYCMNMPTVTELMSDVLDLPRTDRTYLTKKLLESLDREEALSEQQKNTLERRSREIKDGTVVAMGLDELKEAVRHKTA